MVVVGCIDEVNRNSLTLFVKNQATFLVTLIVQGLRIAYAVNSDALDADALLLVQPNGIFFQIDKCLLGVATKCLKACFKQFADFDVHNLCYVQIGRNILTDSVGGIQTYGFYLGWNCLCMRFVQPNGVLIQSIFSCECFLGVTTKLVKAPKQSFTINGLADGCNLGCVKGRTYGFLLRYVFLTTAVDGFVMELSARSELHFREGAAFRSAYLIHIERNDLILRFNRYENLCQLVQCFSSKFVQRYGGNSTSVLEIRIADAIEFSALLLSGILIIKVLDKCRFRKCHGEGVHSVVAMVVSLRPICDASDLASVAVLVVGYLSECGIFIPVQLLHDVNQFPVLTELLGDATRSSHHTSADGMKHCQRSLGNVLRVAKVAFDKVFGNFRFGHLQLLQLGLLLREERSTNGEVTL